MKIIRKSRRVEAKELKLHFERVEVRGSGFSFPCDEQGSVEMGQLQPAALANYELCLQGRDSDGMKLTPGKVRASHSRYTEPAIGLCECCGCELEIPNFTNRCKCGAYYNSYGQRLVDPKYWGEEAGEHPADILRIR